MKNPDWRKDRRKTGGGIKIISGRIFARIQYLDETTGKRKEKLREAPNRTKAREYVRDMRDELERGGQGALESDKATFIQVADRYQRIKLVPPIFQNGIKVSGQRTYLKQISLLKALKQHFGNRKIRSIRAGDIEAFKLVRLGDPVVIRKYVKEPNPEPGRKKNLRRIVEQKRQRSIAAVNRELSLLRQVFVFAEAEDLIFLNPFARATKVISTAAEVQRDRVLSREEEILLLSACETESRKHIRPVVIMAIDTAMRRGEILKLRWEDVNFLEGSVMIRATNSKTEKRRIVGMTGRVRRELYRLWEASPKQPSILVFGIESDFKRAWSSARDKAGCQDLHFHDLRHTAITRMIRSGAPASEVMKISGHSEMRTFQRYVNLTSDSVAMAAEMLDKFNRDTPASLSSEVIN